MDDLYGQADSLGTLPRYDFRRGDSQFDKSIGGTAHGDHTGIELDYLAYQHYVSVIDVSDAQIFSGPAHRF